VEEKTFSEKPIEDSIEKFALLKKAKKYWLKILFFSVLVLIVAWCLVFAGYQLGRKQVPPGISEKPTPALTPEPTSNWKVFRDGKYGLEIKYPPELKRLELPDTTITLVTFDYELELRPGPTTGTTLKGAKFELKVFPLPEEDFVTRRCEYLKTDPLNPECKQTTFFNLPAREIIYKEKGEIRQKIIIVEREGNVYRFSADISYPLSEHQNFFDIFDQMIFTFRFISPESLIPLPTPTPVPIEDWKTYKNDQYRYEVKYPPVSQLQTFGESSLFGIPGCGWWCVFEISADYLGGNSLEDYIQTKLGLPKDKSLTQFFQEVGWEYARKEVNNRSWLYFHQTEGPGEGRYHNFIYQDDIVVDIITFSNQTQENEKFNLILSTFKFLD